MDGYGRVSINMGSFLTLQGLSPVVSGRERLCCVAGWGDGMWWERGWGGGGEWCVFGFLFPFLSFFLDIIIIIYYTK